MRGWLWYSVLRLKSLSISLESFDSEEITGAENDRVDESMRVSVDSKEISVEVGKGDDSSIRGMLLFTEDKELTDKLGLEHSERKV